MSPANERSTVLLAKQPYALIAQKWTRCRIISSSVLGIQTNVYTVRACSRLRLNSPIDREYRRARRGLCQRCQNSSGHRVTLLRLITWALAVWEGRVSGGMTRVVLGGGGRGEMEESLLFGMRGINCIWGVVKRVPKMELKLCLFLTCLMASRKIASICCASSFFGWKMGLIMFLFFFIGLLREWCGIMYKNALCRLLCHHTETRGHYWLRWMRAWGMGRKATVAPGSLVWFQAALVWTLFADCSWLDQKNLENLEYIEFSLQSKGHNGCLGGLRGLKINHTV